MVFQDRWSLMAVVSQDRFHCTVILAYKGDPRDADLLLQCGFVGRRGGGFTMAFEVDWTLYAGYKAPSRVTDCPRKPFCLQPSMLFLDWLRFGKVVAYAEVTLHTVKPVLRDSCHETACLDRSHIFWQDLHFNITEPVTRDHLP